MVRRLISKDCMSKTKNQTWGPETRLDSLGLPFLDVVLTERFLLPPSQLTQMGEEVPNTLGDVARISGMPHDEICCIINECIEIGRDIWIEVQDLAIEASTEGTIVVDMRPNVSFETEPLHESARLFHMQSPATLLPFLRTCKRVLVISHSDGHAWSAAMALRKMSVRAFLPKSI